jgi:hypothetical protein
VERLHVHSSNIRSVGYDPTTRLLEVEFHRGSVYEYSDVPETVHQALMSASSKGSYLNTQVKPRYRCRQLG